MGTEIERKFLVIGEAWHGSALRRSVPGVDYCQGYIATRDHRTVRARIAGEKAYLTLKGPVSGFSRAEFEYEIPVAEARQILDELCDRPLIEKVRYKILVGSHVWELDEFRGDNAELLLAEVELESESEEFELPIWAGEEVTGDRRYYNSCLAKYPYGEWTESERG